MTEVLPTLYQAWIDELLPEGIPPETRATCSSCAMVDRGDAASPDASFLPHLKCCTYYPELSNFLVGRILADERPEIAAARRTIEKRIEARAGATPASLTAPASYQSIYRNVNAAPGAFGRMASLRCPFYVEEGDLCGIWQHREGVCATFFCKYVRGPVGRGFWRVLHAFLRHLEVGLRTWCVEELDARGEMAMATWIAESTPARAMDGDASAAVGPGAAYAQLWGPWAGREADFYRECARRVAPLTLAQVLDICGVQARAASRVVVTLHARLRRDPPPERVARGAAGLVQIGRGPGLMRVRHARTPHDYVDVPARLLDGLSRLIARPLAPAREALRAEGLELDDQTLGALLDFEVLVPAYSEPAR